MSQTVHVFAFTHRMGKLLALAKASYVGLWAYPRLTVLYAAATRWPEHYEFVRDYIESYIEDRYYNDMIDRRDYSGDLDVPAEQIQSAFLEIIEGMPLLDDITDVVDEDFIINIHLYRVVYIPPRGEILVIKR